MLQKNKFGIFKNDLLYLQPSKRDKTKNKLVTKTDKVQNVKLTYRNDAGNTPTYDLGFTSCIFK